MKIMTVTDPRTGQQSAMPAPYTATQQALYAAAAARQGLVVTFTQR